MNKEQKYVGVDRSKDSLDIAVFDSNQRWRFNNSPVGIKRAVGMFGTIKPELVVFEATWGLEIPCNNHRPVRKRRPILKKPCMMIRLLFLH